MRKFRQLLGIPPALWKLDVDSAFRRVPLDKSHTWAAGVAFRFQLAVSKSCTCARERRQRFCLQVYVSQHKSSPFGAASSVHHWERVGDAIAVFARRLLHLPVLRYVDDYFSLDR